MIIGKNRRLFICALLLALLVTPLILYYNFFNASLSLININKLTIIGNTSFYVQQPSGKSAGSAPNDHTSLNTPQPVINLELGEVNNNVLKQTSWWTLTSESQKVAIIVPYRNRKAHLSQFLTRMLPFLRTQKKQYVILITEQAGNQSFNRAKLFNAAVKEIRKSPPGDQLHEIDCFIFHDVDKVPTSLSTVYECGQNVRQLAIAFRSEKETKWLYREFLGAVTAFSWKHLERINGASNLFYGWGGEDDDLAIRLRLNNIAVDRPSNHDGIFDEFESNHPRDRNAERFDLVAEKNVSSRWRNDGINQTRYELLSRIDYDLFVWILVSL
ncbi:hypothetical protein AAHC03_020626 [Spirometra sp. Aus1]